MNDERVLDEVGEAGEGFGIGEDPTADSRGDDKPFFTIPGPPIPGKTLWRISPL